jgi:hypothetical protein
MAKKKIDETDGSEEARWSRAYFATHDSINGAIKWIRIALSAVDLKLSEELSLRAELNALEGKKARLEAARQAFSEGRAGINPPSDGEVAKITNVLNQIRGLTATATRVKSGLKFATTALTLFNKIQST